MYLISDAELIKNCQRGKSESFSGLVDRYKDRVYSTALRISGNPHDAEDIAQDAFISAYRAIRSFDLNREFAPWLLRIVTNLSIDYTRRKQRQDIPLDELEANPGEFAGSLASGDNPLEDAETSELCQLAEQIIMQMPPEYRAVITLYYNEDFTYREIADALNMPIGTVKTYIHRSREILRTRLKNVLKEHIEA